MTTRRRLILIVGVAGLAAVVAYFAHLGPKGDPEPAAPAAVAKVVSAPAHAPAAPAPASAPRASSDSAWPEFAARFGSDLEPRFSTQGRLISARGKPGAGARAGNDFDPRDPQKAIARAREIVAAARGLLGLRDDLPLATPVARGGEASAQVFFRESAGGTPLAPAGSVTVDLGPQGELLALSSDYAPEVAVSGSVRLDAQGARDVASSSIVVERGQPQVEGGSRVAWIVGRLSKPGEPMQARQAYEFSVQGRQVVVDAETGEVLFRRDRRQF